MKLSSLTGAELRKRLRGNGLSFAVGGFNICLRSPLEHVAKSLAFFYVDYALVEDGDFIDFSVELRSPGLVRQWLRPQVNFYFDGHMPFKPLPKVQAFAMFEWGLNWVIANHAHQFLVIHAAVVERNGRAIILPGSPGSGKSTLCAALVSRGWRLLSDEMALISTADGLIRPVPRPISLKNASIDIIRAFSSEMAIGDVVENTAKGSVAHARPPAPSIMAGGQGANPAFVIFPKWRADGELLLTAMGKGQALVKTAENSFNYNVMGAAGFELLADTIEKCDCYSFIYRHLDEAIICMERLVSDG